MKIEEKVQREVVRLLNTWMEGYETELLERFAKWCNENLDSGKTIINNKHHTIWFVRKKGGS